MVPSLGERLHTRIHFSIKTKLIGLTAIVIAVIVGALTSLFSLRELRSLRSDQVSRIATYAAMLSGQARTAVALDDRMTASDVLSSLAADPDVVAVTLLGDSGNELFRQGKPVVVAALRHNAGKATQVYESDDRVAVAAVVPTLEGPQGTLVIELSNARVQALQHGAIATAIVAGTVALLFGAVAAALIARSMVRRLRTLVDSATAVSRDATTTMTFDQSDDEIGRLGEAFNLMLSRLRQDQHRLRKTVADLTTVEAELACTNHELELRVDQRTAELSCANRQLHAEMAHRSQMEIELRQAQKLESVGRLASGIAHEINTPVQFVSDSCSFLETASQDLIAVIIAYRVALEGLDREATAAATAAAVAQMIETETEHDVAYLIEQIPLAISRALQGLQRVSAIVRAMKEFAYPDRNEQAPADLNRAILSTLTVSRNEYKYVAEVKTELEDLPLVTCHIGELNQVVLNIVVNAAHAIASAQAEGTRAGLIAIRTRIRGETVEIEIEDNGCGIPPESIDKIFDPFFTTKEIGKGTGQGLAIARGVVVDKHAGKIDVTSRVGQGTTFLITLPVLGRDCGDVTTAALAS